MRWGIANLNGSIFMEMRAIIHIGHELDLCRNRQTIQEEDTMGSDADCVFCKILSGEIPSVGVYEDDETFAFMDINPVNAGHVLVIPKFHAPNIFEISEDRLSACTVTVQKVALAVKKVVPLDGLNIVQANGEGAAQSVLHFHFHVMPRRKGDDLKLNWALVPGDIGEITAVGEKIKAELA